MSGFIAFVIKRRGSEFALKGMGYVVLIFGSSMLCDLGYIALTRFVLGRVKQIDRVWVIIVVVIGNLLAAAIPLLAPIYGGLVLFKLAPQAGAAILASLLFNSIDILAGSAAFVVAALLLLHRLLWPAIQRPLFAVYRFSPLKQKKWLVTVGLALALLPQHLTGEVIKSFIDKLL
jgi:hypothetical protein